MRKLSVIKRARHRALLELDLLHWVHQTRRLRSGGGERAQKTVLFCELMASIATTKVEALFAAMLRQRGYEVVVLLPRPDTILQRIFLATGPTRFVYFEQLVAPFDTEASTYQADELLGNVPGVDALVDVVVGGYRIGRNAVSKAVRELRIGRLEFSQPEQMRVLKAAISASLLAMRVASRVVDEVRPSLALFNERGYTPAGEVFDACLLGGVDVVQWLGAPQADRLLFKRYDLATRDQHPFALGKDTWDRLLRDGLSEGRAQEIMSRLAGHYESGVWYNRQQLQEGKSIFDREDTRRRLGVMDGRKVAVIFSHILYDATFFYGDSLYPDYETWLVDTVRSAIANPSLDWVVKVHPVNVWRSRMDGKPMEQLEVLALRKAFGELPAHVRILPADTEINTFSLFGAIDYGLTVRGTIGMELPCFGVPVVTAGSGRYAGNGFTLDAVDVEEYRALLARLHELKPLSEEHIARARLYAWGTFFLRPFPITSFEIDFHADTFKLPHLAVDVRIRSSRRGSILGSRDMNRIASWLVSERSSDLLAESD